jgi:hypothetical protein
MLQNTLAAVIDFNSTFFTQRPFGMRIRKRILAEKLKYLAQLCLRSESGSSVVQICFLYLQSILIVHSSIQYKYL